MGVGQTFGLYTYNSDDGTTYSVKLSSDDAIQGGFQSAPPGQKLWPFHNKHMRHVWGKDAAGHRTRLPCADQTNVYFLNGGVFELQGRNYTVYGQIGEFRDFRNI